MDLFNWDIKLFEFINYSISNVLFDLVLPFLRNAYFWIPLYLFIISFVFFNYGRKAYWFVLFVLLTVSTSDLISSRVVKSAFKRVRPCNTEYIQVIERVRCGSGYSFTSTHASNHFALAAFIVMSLGRYYRRINPWLWFWAAIISFSQVYVGVHYPLDILGGAILGILIGSLWSFTFNRYYGHIFNKNIEVA